MGHPLLNVHSGDYAKWDESGNVIILGRKDNQVKLRGLRIELSEIEGLIEKQPDIKKAVIVIRKLSGQDNLCTYFTADSQIDVPAARLQRLSMSKESAQLMTSSSLAGLHLLLPAL